MSEPRWGSGELRHKLSVEMTDAARHNDTLGVLDVDEDGASVTMDLSTGTIAQAKIVCPHWDDWIENSWIRIVHEIPEHAYRRVLGTFFVHGESPVFEYGSRAASPTLYSSIKALSMDQIPSPIFVGEGSPVSRVLSTILDPFTRHTISPACGEYYYTSSAYVLDAGDDKLEALQRITKQVNWEYVLQGDGSLLFRPFVPFAARSASYTIDAAASNSVIHENTLKPETTKLAVPGRSIVVWKGDNSSDEPVSAYADVGVDDPASPQRRGYVVSTIRELSDIAGERSSRNALVYARQFLERDSAIQRKWTMETLWLPVEIGDVIMFRPDAEEPFTKTVVQSIEHDLSKWKLKMVLAEVR